ncbi:ABC transporter substrate-binding protein [Crenalkalicoccus roseus]|uniref:ABC transporter substrate-binding protein n=1 Tax=Crenalkalicoccus roseus TaxID=1485588 RepID=UPI00195D9838|nr:ABC transporter substrate-binding protein [Crenalkalicoccus roseus]
MRIFKRALLGGTAALLAAIFASPPMLSSRGLISGATAQPQVPAAGALPAPTTATGPLRIGVLDDMSGLYADITGPGGVIAVRMAVEDFGGRVLDRHIEVVSGDHQNRADVGSGIARRWFDVEGVHMITGLGNSSVALSVQQLARERGRINIVSGAATTELTGRQCSPTGVHWTYDTYALARGTGTALLQEGGQRWFFLTADYAFGHALERDTAAVVLAGGGTVVGRARHPLNTADFSSFLLTAQGARADVIALANAGGDTINAVKQAAEFGLTRSGNRRLAALLMMVTDVRAIGLQTAQGLVFTESFYWDMDDATRAFSQRFFERHGAMPTMLQAGMYGATLHYLRAVQAAGTADDAAAVMARMREMPINDFMTRDGRLREDGRVIRDVHLMQVKTPEESTGPWDLMRVVRTIPGDQAFRPLAESECPLVVSRR